jgi:hypothetical protein
VHAPNSKDLPDVVPAVIEMETSPVRDAHRSESEVSLAAKGAKALFCAIEDGIHCVESCGYLREEMIVRE